MQSSRSFVMLWLSAVFLVVVSAYDDVKFLYDGYGNAGCVGNDYGLQLQGLDLVCDQGYCEMGSEAYVRGNFSSNTRDLPLNGTVELKVCKWFGSSCTKVIQKYNLTLMDELNYIGQLGYSGEDGAGEYYYSFDDSFLLPEDYYGYVHYGEDEGDREDYYYHAYEDEDDYTLSKFLSTTFKFTVQFKFIPWVDPYEEVEEYDEEDAEYYYNHPNVRCHVQFKIPQHDSDYLSQMFLTTYATVVGVLGLLGAGSFYGYKARKCCVQADLDDESIDNDVTDFVNMGPDKSSGRV